MVALSTSTSASNASVLGLSAATGQTSSFLKNTTAPKDTTELVRRDVNANSTSIANQTANVAAPAIAKLAQPSDVDVTSLIATSLNSSTSVDVLVKNSNDAVASNVQNITSKPLSTAPVEPLAKPVEKSESTTPVADKSDGITVSRESNVKSAVAAASSAYTTTANYGNKGSGGSGTFTLSA